MQLRGLRQTSDVRFAEVILQWFHYRHRVLVGSNENDVRLTD